MALPIRTTLDDIRAICDYLAKKPTGATVKEAKAVLDKRRLDPRKIAALKYWGLLEEQDRLRLSTIGWEFTKNSGINEASVLTAVVQRIDAYRAILERAALKKEESLSTVDVAAHWHDHFKPEVSDSDKILNDQAVCFFQVSQGAGLGTLIIGRHGSLTRFEISKPAIQAFVNGQAPPVQHTSEEGTPSTEADSKTLPVGNELPTNELPTTGDKRPGQGIFIAHGKNRKPLDQLKEILDQFKIPYKVAVEEPNLGRPIGRKVKEIMQSCNCAILIFTADEEFSDADGNAVWRPSENVVYELGAAGFLYGDRIVILKEEKVEFPSNFRDLGYISFDQDQLGAKSMDVLRELIAFGIVKVST